MAKYRIAWMPGDGVGHDVMEAARLVLDRMKLDAEYVPCDIGWEFWCKEGNALPDRTVKALKETTCGLFGAITSKPQSEAKEEFAPELKDKPLVYFSPIVGLRQMFNLHTNMRPCKSYPRNPLNFRGTKITNPSVDHVPTDHAGLRETGGLLMRCLKDVAKSYPGSRADDANIDAICMWMFKNPQDYSVLVAENMFADIVSDLCAGLMGGLGFAPSGNLGDNYADFEPTHGSAPKYAGQYKVNPIAMLLTAKLMLDWLKETEMATRLESAIARVIAEGKVRTYDMGGKASTLDVAKAIAEYASS